jgi:REP element-mobilizing transposase RayT
MAKKSTRIPFEADHVFHLYNRGNNRERLFYSPGDYQVFLDYYGAYPGTLADTYSYCLIPNHFHFLIRIKMESDEREFVRRMRIWLIKYAMYINRSKNRRGHLFTRPINRIKVTDETYLKHLVRYIHLNPVKHGLKFTHQNYPYSSYREFLAKDHNGIVSKKETLELFNDDPLEFIDYHLIDHTNDEIEQYIIEEVN